MELMTPPPPQGFLLDSATSGAYTTESAIMNRFASAEDVTAGNPFLATAVTAPPSPNPFEHLPPGASDADPFDLFQHFTSAPASPARAAAIYAQFDSVDGDGPGYDKADDGFQPRVSYSTVASTVPFDWEQKPGKPKPEFTSAVATVDGGEVDDTDFDFGVLLDKATQTQELSTADELFDEGKIRPLKPPPRLLDGGSVGSTPRSARSVMWSPRLRNLVGPGSSDFDPFAAALAKAPSPLGAGSKDDEGGIESSSSPMNPHSATSPTSTAPATNNGGRKKWRLSDLLLFRRASAKGRAACNISMDPVFRYAPVQQLGTPVKKARAGSVATDGNASAGKRKKQSKKAEAAAAPEGGMPMPHRQSMMGCVRLHPGLNRLAKGFNGHSAHLGRGSARSATKG
ncbi:uncharacterized protein LOC133917726 [Phragmites australis]|uniref:uncharacterized protein LOC133917726 n=1 Tax=Phragmites australis TaxID=29695 RepID=UPI002D77CAE3|nr:uncharacterized protein LOC133917726 [Phragmites australis]